jgi:phage tail sheath gpL-like
MTDIGFNYVPANQRVPGIYPEVEGDIPGQPPQWTLMIGQTITPQAQVPIKISSVAAAVRRFGAGSMLGSMVERYLASDPNGTLWVLPMQDFGTQNVSVAVTSGSPTVSNLPTNTVNGMTISGSGSTIANNATLLNYNSSNGTATLVVPANFTGSTGSVSATINGTISASIGATASSAAITGLPANLTAGMTITGTGVPTGAMLSNYNALAGTGTLVVASNATATNASYAVVLGISGNTMKATGSINFGSASHTPTEDGVLYIYIAGRLVAVPVSQGTPVATIAANVASAINGYFDANDLGLKTKQRNFLGVSMPVSASATTVGSNNVVILTANHVGYVGNTIDIQLNYYGTAGQQEIPAGMSIAVTAMSGGALDPLTNGLDAVLGDTQYDFIVHPYTTTTALDDFQTLMSDSTGRWSPLRKVYGHVFTAVNFAGNGSNATSFGTLRNDRHMTIVCYENGSPSPGYDVASSYCGAFAASSRIDPARPTQSLRVVDILAPHRHDRFSNATRQTLLGTGLALMDYNPDYTCNILRAVTTYQLDDNGTPDIAYRDTETLYTLMAVVRQLTADWGAAFPRAKILDDDTAFGPGNTFTAGLPDQAVVTIKSGKAVIVASYSRMATGSGQSVWLTDVDTFKQNLVLQRNSSDPTRMDALLPIVLASGLRVTAMKVDFALQANS